jgi:polyhydroxybutyrate depolymerase
MPGGWGRSACRRVQLSGPTLGSSNRSRSHICMNPVETARTQKMPRRRWWKWSLYFLAALVFGTVVLVGLIYWELHRTNGEVLTGGQKRAYFLHLPETISSDRPTPLVICLHGFAEWPAHVMRLSHWNRLADEFGFLVVYPRGSGFPFRWRCGGGFGEQEGQSEDVQFISDLIDQLEKKYRIDKARIYANGLSNGGGMSFLLAGKLSERIAAIGGVAGTYVLPWTEYTPKRPVPAIIFHGTADPLVPFHAKSSGRVSMLPDIPQWVQSLAEHNGCQTNPVPLPGSGSVSGVRYPGAANKAEVIFYSVAGGGHTWPGGKPMSEFITGKTTADVDATRLMWSFFTEHPLVR